MNLFTCAIVIIATLVLLGPGKSDAEKNKSDGNNKKSNGTGGDTSATSSTGGNSDKTLSSAPTKLDHKTTTKPGGAKKSHLPETTKPSSSYSDLIENKGTSLVFIVLSGLVAKYFRN